MRSASRETGLFKRPPRQKGWPAEKTPSEPPAQNPPGVQSAFGAGIDLYKDAGSFVGADSPQGRLSLVHVTQIRVHWDDTDKAGIVHHSNYFRWFEEGEVELLRQPGKSRKQMAEESATTYPRVKVSCDFFAPAFDDDVLEVRTSVLEISAKTYRLRHEIHRPADGKHLATGEVVVCCVRAQADGSFRSHPLPAEMVAALKRHLLPRREGAS